ncbi:Uncharacterised protein [Enterobacter cloacae]|nr:Uncharacterised protein [Enterobacter cloacae]
MAIRQIVSRLDSHNIARHQRPRVDLFSDAMRVLMDKQLMTHAMARSVIEIQPHLPQRPTREGIKLMPLGAGRELQGNQRQKAFQHGGIV